MKLWKRVGSVGIPLFAMASLAGSGYAVWYFFNDSGSSISVSGKVEEKVVLSDFGEITFSDVNSTSENSKSDTIITFIFEPDRISFANNMKVSFDFADSIDLSTYASEGKYLNFNLNINLSGNSAGIVGNVLHIDDFTYENFSGSDDYSVRFVGVWGTAMLIEDTDDFKGKFPYTWEFSQLKLGYASSLIDSDSAFKKLRNACDDCYITYAFSVTVDDHPNY